MIKPPTLSLLPHLILGICLYMGSSLGWTADRSPMDLVNYLQSLARQQGFTLKGKERLLPATIRPPLGPAAQQIQSLLEDYDYALVHSANGAVRRLIIIGQKRAAPPPPPEPSAGAEEENVITTRRKGQHHLVPVELFGPDGKSQATELLVDTGASLVVLPLSYAGTLGLDSESFEARELQTAKGKLNARIGRLPQLRLGRDLISDVEAAFVEDTLLGDNPLLGMNIIGRYVFILDDERNELTLIPDK